MCTIVSFGMYRRLAFTVQQEENAARWAPALFFTLPPTHHHLSCCKAALQRRYYISHLGACKIVQICPNTQVLQEKMQKKKAGLARHRSEDVAMQSAWKQIRLPYIHPLKLLSRFEHPSNHPHRPTSPVARFSIREEHTVIGI